MSNTMVEETRALLRDAREALNQVTVEVCTLEYLAGNEFPQLTYLADDIHERTRALAAGLVILAKAHLDATGIRRVIEQ